MKKGEKAPAGEAMPKGVELDKNSQKLVDEAVKALTLGKGELSPAERLEFLRKRERTNDGLFFLFDFQWIVKINVKFYV